MKNMYFYKTKIGDICITDDGNSITNLFFEKSNLGMNDNVYETKLIKEAAKQLNEYFNGLRTKFTIPLNPCGTEFQQTVWKALINIPYGKSQSYGQIADSIGNYKAARAVGNANNKNPIPIFIPCHRVIGADGSLTGYAGGLKIKQFLLTLEKINFK